MAKRGRKKLNTTNIINTVSNCSLCLNENQPIYQCQKFLLDDLENTFNCPISFSERNVFKLCLSCSYHINVLSKFVNQNICISGKTPICFMCKNFTVFDIRPEDLKIKIKVTPFVTQVEDAENYYSCVVCFYHLVEFQRFTTLIDAYKKSLNKSGSRSSTSNNSRVNKRHPVVLLQKLDLSKFKITPFRLLQTLNSSFDSNSFKPDTSIRSRNAKRSNDDHSLVSSTPTKRIKFDTRSISSSSTPLINKQISVCIAPMKPILKNSPSRQMIMKVPDKIKPEISPVVKKKETKPIRPPPKRSITPKKKPPPLKIRLPPPKKPKAKITKSEAPTAKITKSEAPVVKKTVKKQKKTAEKKENVVSSSSQRLNSRRKNLTPGISDSEQSIDSTVHETSKTNETDDSVTDTNDNSQASTSDEPLKVTKVQRRTTPKKDKVKLTASALENNFADLVDQSSNKQDEPVNETSIELEETMEKGDNDSVVNIPVINKDVTTNEESAVDLTTDNENLEKIVSTEIGDKDQSTIENGKKSNNEDSDEDVVAKVSQKSATDNMESLSLMTDDDEETTDKLSSKDQTGNKNVQHKNGENVDGEIDNAVSKDSFAKVATSLDDKVQNNEENSNSFQGKGILDDSSSTDSFLQKSTTAKNDFNIDCLFDELKN